jgi:hypothetical protein
MGTLTPKRTATSEYVFNASPQSHADIDSYRGGVPHLVIADGPAEVVIKPHDDVPVGETVQFFDDLAEAARRCALELRAFDESAQR